jgi:hypothetical protein
MKKIIFISLLTCNVLRLLSSANTMVGMNAPTKPSGAGIDSIHDGASQTKSGWDLLGEAVDDIGHGIGKTVHGVVTLPEQGAYYVADEFVKGVNTGEDIYHGAVDAVGNKYHTSVDKISNVKNKIKKSVSDSYHRTTNEIANFIDDRANSVKTGYDKVKQLGHVVKKNIGNVYDETAHKVLEYGKDLGQDTRVVLGGALMVPDLAVHGVRVTTGELDDFLQRNANNISGKNMSSIYNNSNNSSN